MVICVFPFRMAGRWSVRRCCERREGKRSRKAPKTVHLRLVAALYVGRRGENSKLTGAASPRQRLGAPWGERLLGSSPARAPACARATACARPPDAGDRPP